MLVPRQCGGHCRQGKVQGLCQKMAFIFLSLEGLWIYKCVVFTTSRVAVSCFCEDGLARAAAGNSGNSCSDFRLDHHTVKGRGGDQAAMGKTQIAQPPARTDGAPCLSVVARFAP